MPSNTCCCFHLSLYLFLNSFCWCGCLLVYTFCSVICNLLGYRIIFVTFPLHAYDSSRKAKKRGKLFQQGNSKGVGYTCIESRRRKRKINVNRVLATDSLMRWAESKWFMRSFAHLRMTGKAISLGSFRMLSYHAWSAIDP